MSHTVAVADDMHHLPLRAVYRFDGVVMPTVDEWLSTAEFAYFSGAHEAYERLPQKVSACRRKLFYRRGRYWILIDRFTAASPEHRHVYSNASRCIPLYRTTASLPATAATVPPRRGTLAPAPTRSAATTRSDQLTFTKP
jgi:hypothetical protein